LNEFDGAGRCGYFFIDNGASKSYTNNLDLLTAVSDVELSFRVGSGEQLVSTHLVAINGIKYFHYCKDLAYNLLSQRDLEKSGLVLFYCNGMLRISFQIIIHNSTLNVRIL
jgi:hypothetical protein